MGSYFERIAKNTGFGLVSSVIVLVAGVTRSFFLAKYFDLPNFGYFIICTNIAAFARLLMTIGVGETIIRFYPEFEINERRDALASLVVLLAYISGLVNLVIVLSAWSFAPVIAESWYHQPDLWKPIFYSALLSGGFLFGNSATAILRVQNKFHLAVIFPSIGACLSVFLIFVLEACSNLTVTSAVIAVGLGEAFGIVGTTVLGFLKVFRHLTFSAAVFRLEPLRSSRREIRSTLTQTSLFGILDSSTQIGGVFLLGILGSPAQVAILGMSMQLVRPLNMVQASLGSAISPEVTRMHAEKNFKELYRFIFRYLRIVLAIVGAMIILVWLVAPLAISFFLKEDYLQAIPVFLVFLTTYGLVMAFQPFLPIAIARGEVGRRNIMVCVRFLYLGIACLFGLTAMGVALTLLAGNLTIRCFNDFPLLRELKRAL